MLSDARNECTLPWRGQYRSNTAVQRTLATHPTQARHSNTHRLTRFNSPQINPNARTTAARTCTCLITSPRPTTPTDPGLPFHPSSHLFTNPTSEQVAGPKPKPQSPPPLSSCTPSQNSDRARKTPWEHTTQSGAPAPSHPPPHRFHWLRAPFAPRPFPLPRLKGGKRRDPPFLLFLSSLGCSVGRRRAWGLEEKGQRLFLHTGGGCSSCFYDGEEGGDGLGLGLAREVLGMVERLRDVGEN